MTTLNRDQSSEIEQERDRQFGLILRKATLTAAVIVTVLIFYPQAAPEFASPPAIVQPQPVEPLPLAPLSIEAPVPVSEQAPAPMAAVREPEPEPVRAAPVEKPVIKVFQRPEVVTRSSRSRDEIEAVFMRNRQAISAVYNGALRRNPTLKGMLVLRMRIEPAGHVTECEVVSSEIKDEALLQELIDRVRRFRFEDRNVAPITTVKPIDFYPA